MRRRRASHSSRTAASACSAPRRCATDSACCARPGSSRSCARGEARWARGSSPTVWWTGCTGCRRRCGSEKAPCPRLPAWPRPPAPPRPGRHRGGRSLFGEYAPGRRVNLERALRAADRLGGHIVQGHVDGVAVVTQVERRGDAWVYDLRVPAAVRQVSIPGGAITVDGVSLIINDLPGKDVDGETHAVHRDRKSTRLNSSHLVIS